MDYNLLNFSAVFSDIIDVALVWFIFYQVSFLFKNTRSTKLVGGAAVIAFLYIGSIMYNLEALSQVFQAINLVQIGSIILVILFSQEIKEALTSIGIKRMSHYVTEDSQTIEAVTQACLRMSANHVGALVVLTKHDNLKDLTTDAIQLNADVSSHILEAIFFEPTIKSKGNNPLHDGAVVISNNKIVAAKVICKQLSESVELSHQGKGTRHSAGLGFVEQRDCVAVIVSHETGDITLAAHNEKTQWKIDRADLLSALKKSLGMNTAKSSLAKDINNYLFERKFAKLISFLFAVSVWCFAKSSILISCELPQPTVYANGHIWAEDDYVLSIESTAEKNQNIKVNIVNWVKLYYLFRPEDGGKFAFKHAVEINFSEEDAQKLWDSPKKRIKTDLKITSNFKNDISLSDQENEPKVTIKVQRLVKTELKELVAFNIGNHSEVESVEGNINSSLLVPNNFELNSPCVIDLITTNAIKPITGQESWQEIKSAEKFSRNYSDFSGSIDFSKIAELAPIVDYNPNKNVKFRIIVKVTEIPKSEDELIAEKEITAIINAYKTIDELVDKTSVTTKPDRQLIISANIQKEKSLERLTETTKQIEIYTQKKEQKTAEIRKYKQDYDLLMQNFNSSILSDVQKKNNLEIKRVQVPREQTIYDQITEILVNNQKKLKERLTKSEEIYNKYAEAFKPVLEAYDLARKKAEARLAIAPLIAQPELNFKNINDQTLKINTAKLSSTKEILDFFEFTIESLDTFLVSPFIARKPGSLHEYMLLKKAQLEQLDLLIDNLNTQLTPTEMPGWLELHKTQTFVILEDIYFQVEKLSNLDGKISQEKEDVSKILNYRIILFEALQNKLNEAVAIKKELNSIYQKNVIPGDKKLEVIKKKLSDLKIIAQKNCEIYDQKKTIVDRKTRVFKIPAYIDNSNPITNETRKAFEEWPVKYGDYTQPDEKPNYQMGYNLIKNFFIFINAAWEGLNKSTEETEKLNSNYLKSYLAYIEKLEELVNAITTPQ
jgi:diadenylate cyclase